MHTYTQLHIYKILFLASSNT